MFEIIATTIVIISVYLISIPKILGVELMAIAQIFWLIFAILNKHNWLAIQSFILLILQIKAILSWRKKGIGI